MALDGMDAAEPIPLQVRGERVGRDDHLVGGADARAAKGVLMTDLRRSLLDRAKGYEQEV
jgi:hypothetical protein